MSSHKFHKVKPSTIRARSRKKKLAVAGVLIAVALIVSGYFVLSPLLANQVPTSQAPVGKVLLRTSMGNITIALRDDMPITTTNFKNLVQQGVYDGTIFHRVIADFMIQGGDPTGTGFGDPSIPAIKDEFTDYNFNERETVAMANRGPDTGSSQFFINVVDNSARSDHFNSDYPVFGRVQEGMDVVDAIARVATGSGDKPLVDITIIKAEFLP